MSLVQIHDPDPLNLLSVKPGGTLNFAGVLAFRVPTPDSRLVTSIDLLFSQPNAPAATVPFDMTFGSTIGASLWLAGRTLDRGGAGQLIPTVNLVGSRAAPIALPTDVAIDGYADDYPGGQDDIYGELTVSFSVFSPAQGLRISLLVRQEPGPCAICDDEWQQIIALCVPSLIQPPVVG